MAETVMEAARVEEQLARLWRDASSEERSVVRACCTNLVVACADGDEALRETTRCVADISANVPGRAIVVSRTSRGSTGSGELELQVSAHCRRNPGGDQVCSEQVTLEVDGGSEELVPGTVLQLLVEEMPVFTWWRRPGLTDDPLLLPLVALSDRLIVDASQLDRPAARLRELHEIAVKKDWTGWVADLSWARLEPWREGLATFFDAPAARRPLERIAALSVVAHGRAPGAYLAGWLASRLGWTAGDRPDLWRRADGGAVRVEVHPDRELPRGEIGAIRIEAASDGPDLAFVLRRTHKTGSVVMLSVETSGSCPLPSKIELPSRDTAALLCGVLQDSCRDPVFEFALSAAARM